MLSKSSVRLKKGHDVSNVLSVAFRKEIVFHLAKNKLHREASPVFSVNGIPLGQVVITSSPPLPQPPQTTLFPSHPQAWQLPAQSKIE